MKHLKSTIATIILTALIALLLYGIISGALVSVNYYELTLTNADRRLDGAKILFISDLKLTGEASANRAVRLTSRLMELEPDVLILGGDYTGTTVLGQNESAARRARRIYFMSLKDIGVPVYAVEGDCDGESLSEDMQLGGINLLQNDLLPARINDALIYIAGYKDYQNGGRSYKIKDDDPGVLIAVCHDPAAYPMIASLTDSKGNAMVDLILCGHTLAGQINVLGKSLIGKSTDVGASRGAGPWCIVSAGLGCEYLPIRIGSTASCELITLKVK